MANNGLPDAIGAAEPIDQVDRINDFAIQFGVAASGKKSTRIDVRRFVDISQVDMDGSLIRFLLNQVVRVLQIFLQAKTAKVIKHFKGEPQRVHLFMATPAVGLSRFLLESLAECFMVVFWNDCIDRNGEIWNCPCQ